MLSTDKKATEWMAKLLCNGEGFVWRDLTHETRQVYRHLAAIHLLKSTELCRSPTASPQWRARFTQHH